MLPQDDQISRLRKSTIEHMFVSPFPISTKTQHACYICDIYVGSDQSTM